MGLFDRIKGQFLDVIEWLDDSRDTIVWRFPVENNSIQDGGKLVVREGQAAIFVQEGKLSDVFGPGTYELSTRLKAIWGFFESIKYSFNDPYKGDVYFINTRRFIDQKWGTPNPFTMRDPDFGLVRVRAFGNFTYKVTDPAMFLREIVGTDGNFTTSEINGQLKSKLIAGFISSVKESGIGVVDLCGSYMDLGEKLTDDICPIFQERYGMALTDVNISNISPPPEVEEAIDKRSSMGALGNMNTYTQYQAANAIEAAAKNPGGGGAGAAMMNAGMGLAMGNVMTTQMAQSATPPPAPTSNTYHYNGDGGQGQFSTSQVAEKIRANPSGTHNVWQQGWAGWKSWSEVSELAGIVPPPAPAVASSAAVYHYSGPSGKSELSAKEIAAKVSADPSSEHLVWKDGFDGWKAAGDVPEIANSLSSGPPPLPSSGPPPLPKS
jgi:membrane protease subunit (stomatin/prohibitin family)